MADDLVGARPLPDHSRLGQERERLLTPLRRQRSQGLLGAGGIASRERLGQVGREPGQAFARNDANDGRGAALPPRQLRGHGTERRLAEPLAQLGEVLLDRDRAAAALEVGREVAQRLEPPRLGLETRLAVGQESDPGRRSGGSPRSRRSRSG